MTKLDARLRRSRKSRIKIKISGGPRLTVHRTSKHTYAQIIGSDYKVLASVSTLQPEVKESLGNTGNVVAAKLVGQLIAKKAKEAGINDVSFDRSGFKYHGRVQALADAAREHGLTF